MHAPLEGGGRLTRLRKWTEAQAQNRLQRQSLAEVILLDPCAQISETQLSCVVPHAGDGSLGGAPAFESPTVL